MAPHHSKNQETEDYNDVEATNEKKLENYIGNINRLQKHGDMSAIWTEIEKSVRNHS